VAIKQLLNAAKSEQRYNHEIEIVSRFENPNVVTYYHHHFMKTMFYFVMEYCGSLRDKILTNTFTTATEAIEWIQTLASSLRLIHKKE
jgi:serine/threonine protein kinase